MEGVAMQRQIVKKRKIKEKQEWDQEIGFVLSLIWGAKLAAKTFDPHAFLLIRQRRGAPYLSVWQDVCVPLLPIEFQIPARTYKFNADAVQTNRTESDTYAHTHQGEKAKKTRDFWPTNCSI